MRGLWRRLRALLALLAMGALLVGWAFADQLFPPETLTAQTVRVRDGDTLSLGPMTVRLHGIDAPEYRQMCRTAAGQPWPCGRAARAQLEALALTGPVTCTVSATDQYRRKIATCRNATTPDLGEAMVAAGLAISPAERGEAAYAAAEARAARARRGLWQGRFDTPAAWRDAHPR
jgi:endonuclease YncB( thermonuclease family)